MESVVSIKPQAYHDSVTLMAASQELARLPGVVQAAMMMGSAHNKALLQDMLGPLEPSVTAARADDLLIAIQAADAAALQAALNAAEALLRHRVGGAADSRAGVPAPRSLAGGLRQMPDATLALISVPGPFAAREALQALRSGLDVLIFSDNVALADEVLLKRFAAAEGRLCMGPDCGTALIGGVALGFANLLRRGPIGIVSASGTGAQEVAALIDRTGGGISAIIGTGGRDLHPDVGGLMMLAGIDRLAADPSTERILLISKPPDPAVARRILAALQASGKPGIVCFLGYAGEPIEGVELTATLREAAARATGQTLPIDDQALARQAAALARRYPHVGPQGRLPRLRGLFSGGTLCHEARLELARLGLAEASELVDYGDDHFTRGRPHPMIDWTLRLEALGQAAADPGCAVILLDVVLGYAAHADPAALLAPALRAIEQPVILSVCGTDADPQGRGRQVAALVAAGATVAESNLEAARLAGLILREAL